MDGADQTIAATSGAWQKGTLTIGGKAEAVAASGGWTAADTFTLQVVRYRTPFSTTYRFRFADDQVTVDSEQNVGPASHADRAVHRQGRGQLAPFTRRGHQALQAEVDGHLRVLVLDVDGVAVGDAQPAALAARPRDHLRRRRVASVSRRPSRTRRPPP